MQFRIGQRRGGLVPLATAMLVALVGIAAFVITERDPDEVARSHSISMITTAALERAGAIALPSEQQPH